MNIKTACFILTILISVSCASVDTGRYYDEETCHFISNYPKLKVQIKDSSAKQVETGFLGERSIGFNTEDGKILIEVYTMPNINIDYYYPDEAIVKNIRGWVPVGSRFFNKKKWVKVVDYRSKNIINTGYFRRQDKYFLRVSYIKNQPDQSANVEIYKKTLEFPQPLKDRIDKQFSIADSKFEIVE